MRQLNGVVHNFQEQLDYSARLSDEPAWIEFYKRLWPDMIAAIRIDKYSQFQKWGIDREILLPNGKRFSVDEKKRKAQYQDILLEEWSVCDYDRETRTVIKGIKVGWALDAEKRCDFIAYSIPDAGRCWFLPFELLRQTMKANLAKWKQNDAWYPIPARNVGYTTVSVAVPPNELKRALVEQMNRRFGETLPLPVPVQSGQLSLFDHFLVS